MTNLNLEGESDSLSDKQVNFVCEVLEKLGFKGSKVTVATLGKAGDNYSSNVKTITAEREDGTTLKMIAKVAPNSEFLRAFLTTHFRNEFLMYGKVLPKFRQLETEADIPEEDRFKFPICYGIFDEDLHEIILLEDLTENDYIMKDRLKSMTDDEIRVILDSFAKFHSLSFVLKKKDSRMFEEFSSQLTDLFSVPQMEESFNAAMTPLRQTLCSLFDIAKYKEKINSSLSNITNEARKLRKCDAGSKYSVIIHGDAWSNNILLKQNKNTGMTGECMLIDYQQSSERAPVSDLLHLIIGCTDFDTRSKHYDDWIDEYHNKLDKYLSYYGIKANYVYSKEKLLADLKRYSKLFLGVSMAVANILCIDSETAAQFKEAMDSSENIAEIMENLKMHASDSSTIMLLKTKVQGIIDTYYDLGYCS